MTLMGAYTNSLGANFGDHWSGVRMVWMWPRREVFLQARNLGNVAKLQPPYMATFIIIFCHKKLNLVCLKQLTQKPF